MSSGGTAIAPEYVAFADVPPPPVARSWLTGGRPLYGDLTRDDFRKNDQHSDYTGSIAPGVTADFILVDGDVSIEGCFCPGNAFDSHEDLKHQALVWCGEANLLSHATTREVPLVRFRMKG